MKKIETIPDITSFLLYTPVTVFSSSPTPDDPCNIGPSQNGLPPDLVVERSVAIIAVREKGLIDKC